MSPIRFTAIFDQTAVGGAEVMLLEVCRRFDREAVQPSLVCLRQAGPLADEFRAAGVDMTVLDRTGKFDLRTLPRLVRFLIRNRTDVVLMVHFHRASLTLGRIAARLARIPNVVAVRDMDLVSVGRRALPGYVVNSLFLTDVLLLQAPSQGRYLHEQEGVGRSVLSRTREVVVWNGIELAPPATPADQATARASLGLQPDAIAIGITARLNPQKAHHVLIEAVARLLPTHPRVRLVVVGDGERADELRALVDRLGIAERVLFTGMRRDVPQLLPGFDIFCLSSVHEGTPVSVLEAMGAMVPVVVTDCGAVRDMITDGEDGFIVPVGDRVALAEALGRLVADPELRATVGERGRKRVERDFRIEGTVEGLQRLLRDLVLRPEC